MIVEIRALQQIMGASFNLPITTVAERVNKSWKLSLNSCSRRWLKRNCNRESSLIQKGFWQSKTSFRNGLINYKLCFLKLKMGMLSELRIRKMSLLSSDIADEKTIFFQKVETYFEIFNIFEVSCLIRSICCRNKTGKVIGWSNFNPLTASVQTNWLVSIWGQHWYLIG